MQRVFLAAALAISLAACASSDRISMTQPEGYVSIAPVRTAGIPWSRAHVAEVVLSEYAFAPNSLTFEAGVPYRLILRNAGASGHTFVSERFFKSIAVRKLQGPKKSYDYPYVQTIRLEPGQKKELQFLPMQRGTYPLHCSVPLHESFGMTGTITVR